MKIKKWCTPDGQTSQLGNHSWNVSRLIDAAKDLEVREADIDFLNIHHVYKEWTLRDAVMHMQAVLDADMSCPIILDEDGEIMDGRHRIMKALLEGRKTIKVVRFDENPDPCQIEPYK